MNSYFVNPPYCYRGAVVDRTGGHCLTSPADQLHAAGVDYQSPQLLRAHYDELYGYTGGYGSYAAANDKVGQQNGSIGGYYAELDTTRRHFGSFSTSGGGQQLPLIDTSSGIAFQSRNTAQSPPLPTPIDFCRPYMQKDPVGYQPTVTRHTGSGNDGHLVSSFSSTAADAHPVPTTQNKQPEHGTSSGSGLGRRQVDGGRSDCSRSPSGSSSRSSSPGGASAEPGPAVDCRASNGEVENGTGSSEAGGGNSSSVLTHTSSTKNQTTATCQYQQQIYPWMRRIHLANGTITSLHMHSIHLMSRRFHIIIIIVVKNEKIRVTL